MDITAAFDTVQHNLLLTRLQEAGIDGSALTWITNYLTDRKQLVLYKGKKSSETDVNDGVPQGSILGPLFFNIYMAPLGRFLTSMGVSHHIYADDVLVYFTLDEKSCEERYQKILDQVTNWMVKSYLAVNPTKTQAVLFNTGKRLIPPLPNLKIMDEPVKIDEDGVIKYLGLHLDTRLTFSHHILMVTRNTFAVLRTIRRVRTSLNVKTSLMLVNSLILSRIEYCCSVLYGIADKEMNKMNKLIRASARVVFKMKRGSSISAKMKELQWLDFKMMSIHRMGCLIHKVLHTGVPEYLQLLQYFPPRELRSQNQNLLQIASNNRSVGIHIWNVKASKIWNQLPQRLKEEKHRKRFSNEMIKHLLMTED
jgi:hypothetical protein